MSHLNKIPMAVNIKLHHGDRSIHTISRGTQTAAVNLCLRCNSLEKEDTEVKTWLNASHATTKSSSEEVREGNGRLTSSMQKEGMNTNEESLMMVCLDDPKDLDLSMAQVLAKYPDKPVIYRDLSVNRMMPVNYTFCGVNNSQNRKPSRKRTGNYEINGDLRHNQIRPIKQCKRYTIDVNPNISEDKFCIKQETEDQLVKSPMSRNQLPHNPNSTQKEGVNNNKLPESIGYEQNRCNICLKVYKTAMTLTRHQRKCVKPAMKCTSKENEAEETRKQVGNPPININESHQGRDSPQQVNKIQVQMDNSLPNKTSDGVAPENSMGHHQRHYKEDKTLGDLATINTNELSEQNYMLSLIKESHDVPSGSLMSKYQSPNNNEKLIWNIVMKSEDELLNTVSCDLALSSQSSDEN